MKIKSRVKAGGDVSIRPPDGGGFINNHNQTPRVKSNMKSGDGRGGTIGYNHNQTGRAKARNKAQS